MRPNRLIHDLAHFMVSRSQNPLVFIVIFFFAFQVHRCQKGVEIQHQQSLGETSTQLEVTTLLTLSPI